MRLYINGEGVEVDAQPDEQLIFVLRDRLGLVGAKHGCGAEQCGACVVLADGEPVYACTVTAAQIAGRQLETVEGLSSDETLTDLQQAFLDENAGQCGFCLAGIVVRAEALLRANARPSRDEICAALDPHLCRCGAHPRIIRAVARASEARAEALSP